MRKNEDEFRQPVPGTTLPKLPVEFPPRGELTEKTNVSVGVGVSRYLSLQLSRLATRWINFKVAWKENHAWPVFYCTLVASILSLNFGITLGYASPAIPELLTDDEVTSINDTSIVFSAMVPFGALVSGPIAGWLLDTLGRHMALMFCVVPYTTGWLLIILTRSTTGRAFLPILYIGRFFTGIGVGYTNAAVPLYASELSPSALRGLFVGFFGIFVATGILTIQMFGIIPGATYYWLPVVPLTTIVIFTILMAVSTKETPRWLQKTNRTKGARLVLLWLRGKHYNINKEQKQIADQLANEKKRNLFQKFKHKSARFPLFLGCCLVVFQQLSGINAITFYSEVIFSDIKSIGDNADIVSAACVGGSQVLGALILLVAIDKFGRRKLLLTCAATMSLSATTMAIYYIFNSQPYCNPDDDVNDCVEVLTPLAVISIMVYASSFAAAWGAVPYMVAAELLPLHIRGAGIGVVTCAGWTSSTIVLLAFEPYQETVKPWGAFFTFSLVMLCAFLFVLKFIPETKAKTLEDIQQSAFKSRKYRYSVYEWDADLDSDEPVMIRYFRRNSSMQLPNGAVNISVPNPISIRIPSPINESITSDDETQLENIESTV